MRVTNQATVDRMLSNIALSQRRLATAQEHMGTGLRINRPSDDPQGASRVMAGRTALELNGQYDRNIAVGLSDLSATEAALVRLTELLQRASELAVQGSNGTLTADGRSAIALEVGELLGEAITVGNTSHAGRYLFAGQQTSTTPFVPDSASYPTSVSYAGDSGLIEREISQGARVAVNVPGDDVLPDVFTALIQLRDDLVADDADAVGTDLGTLESTLNSVLQLRAEVGSKMRRVELSQARLEDERARLQTMIGDMEQTDLAEAIVLLQMQETAYQAALGAAGRTLGLSLLDFLR